jgi:transposase-like protein
MLRQHQIKVYPSCPKCGKNNYVSKNGTRINQFSVKQKYYCRADNTWFTPDDGFSRMRFDPKIIMVALDLFNKNISLRGIKQHLLQFYNVDVSHVTIRNWTKKYIDNSEVTLKNVNVFNDVHKSEMELFASVRKTVKIKKSRRR